MRGRPKSFLFQKNTNDFRRRSRSTVGATRSQRRPAVVFQIDAARINILPVGRPGCQTNHERQEFLLGGHPITDIKILIKPHSPVGCKHQHGSTIAQWTGRDDMDSHIPGPLEHHATGIKIKKINAVHHHVNAIQKCFEVLFFDTFWKFSDVEIRD